MTQRLRQIFSAFIALGVALVTPAQAQQRPAGRGCATTENNEASQQQLERLIPGYNRNAKPAPPLSLRRATARNYVIPIVFHVVHNGEPVGTGTNISEARILEQLTRLNEDFAKLNADRTGIPAAFQAAHADVQVQFALAQRDPSGNCINGINRINRNEKGWTAPPFTTTYTNATVKPGSSWDPTKYLNFWVVNLSGGILGYAQFPDNTAALSGLDAVGGAANTDGVVCLSSAVGNGDVSAAPYNLGRTATHEVGHWLGLRHIWGDGSSCSATDYVNDTPSQAAENYGCPTFPSRSCGTTGNGDMFMNYMDYTDDACMFMFSSGQKDRVQAIMAAGTPRRTSLATSPALPPAVTYDALTSTPLVCAGGTILLNGTAPAGYTYQWTGPNGFISNQQNPVLSGPSVTTAASGTYTMTVTPAGGCAVSDFVDVMVRPLSATPTLAASTNSTCSGVPVTLTATPTGDQTLTAINQNWNEGTTENGWTRDNTGSTRGKTPPVWATTVATPGINGTRFVRVSDNTTGNAFTSSALYSPVFSAANLGSLSLTFQHIFEKSSVSTDNGKVEISRDGGTTWTTLRAYNTDQGSTTTTVASPAAVSISLNDYVGQANLRLRWQFRSAGGGSWSVDNIAATGTIANTYAWSVISGDGLPASVGTGNTLVVSPTQNSLYQVTVTAPGSCSSGGTIISVSVPTNTTWTGAAGGGAWNNANNWTACVPTRRMTATIPNGLSTAYPNLSAGTTAEIGNLVQNGELTLSGGSLNLFGDHTGTGTFTHSGGTFNVAGTGLQSLRGLTYGTLTLTGPGNKILQNNATATANVALNGSLLNTGAYTLTLARTAALTETATSYVLGRVFASAAIASGGSSSFNGLGASIAAAAGSTAPGTVQALRVTGETIAHNSLPGGESISRYFDLSPDVNTGLNLNLTFSYNGADLSGKAENRLNLYRALSMGANFERMNASLDLAARQVSVTGVAHLSVWTFAPASAPLPVELTAFTATAVGADARLNWATAAEKNNDYFEVQVSTNGTQFSPIGRVRGQGTSSRAQLYTLTDSKIARYHTALLYYRLRQVDLDGTTTLSPVRTVALSKAADAGFSAQLFPNPSATTTAAPQLLVGSAKASPVTLTLRDAVGRVLSHREVAFSASSALPLPEAAALPAGLYVLEVKQATQQLNVKLLRD